MAGRRQGGPDAEPPARSWTGSGSGARDGTGHPGPGVHGRPAATPLAEPASREAAPTAAAPAGTGRPARRGSEDGSGARAAGGLDRVPVGLLFVVSAVSQYAGAAVAVVLFDVVPPAGVAWLRVVAAAAVMGVWRRPWRQRWRPLRAGGVAEAPARLGLVAAFGVTLAAMNLAFYLAIERLPLGNAVAIEFLGPVLVAAAGTRTRRDLGALLLALGGVGLLLEVELDGSPVGVAFALAAAALWALYIVLGARVAAGGRGVDGLAAGMIAGAVALAPVAGPSALPALADPVLAALCLGVGILSSVLPYVLDQRILVRMGRGRFALFLSLLPATAALIGAVVLGQVPGISETLGITLVVVAVALRSPR